MNNLRFLLIAAVGAVMSLHPVAAAPDYSGYAALLRKHTYRCTKRGIKLTCVNYRGLKQDPGWRGVVAMVAGANPAQLGSSQDRFAFYINAYNILAIDTILSNHPTASIQKIPNVWKRKAGTVAGRSMSLDRLEKHVVKPFGDPRYHFALVCAALSCPDLRREPYTGAKLSRQLYSQTARFLRNPTKGVRLGADKTAQVSKLFDWYSAEFGGRDAIPGYIARYHKGFAGHRIMGSLPYLWALNGR